VTPISQIDALFPKKYRKLSLLTIGPSCDILTSRHSEAVRYLYILAQFAICKLQSANCNLQSAIYSLQSVICPLQSAIRAGIRTRDICLFLTKNAGHEQTKSLGTVPHFRLPGTVFVGRDLLESPFSASVAPLTRRTPTMSMWNKYNTGKARVYLAARGPRRARPHSVAYRDRSMYH
jgi:hypothetical protein